MNLAEAERLLADVGCVAGVHARAIAGDVEVGFGADVPFAPASVVKVLVAVAVEDAVARGDLDPTQRLRIGDGSRTPGPVGLSLFEDDAECSVRACTRVRSLMAQQLTRARIASGFGADASVAAKSGGLVGVVRHEVGVVTPPGTPPVAVAVLTRATTAAAPDGGAVDRAIGRVAAMLVDEVTG